MLFNSYSFIFVFLPVTLTLFFLLSRFKLTSLASASLVIASLFFYSYWNINYLPLLLISILFNFTTGRLLGKENLSHRKSKIILITGLAINLTLLGYYKYTNFVVFNLNRLLHLDILIPKIALPLGISFFTFTQIAYLIDAYKKETQKYNFLDYCLFVTFFPHLIAGPILYHRDIIPQFKRLKNFVFSHKNFSMGLTIFGIGLFKKVIIADNISPWVSAVFNNSGNLTMIDAWVGAISYTFQLFFDFSGYSDMAIGLGLMLNIKLPVNFNSPYKSTSIIEFWRRWHITLSEFLKKYLYIPLGGNRLGFPRKMFNLFITMLLGGLWHGAGWTFIIWGGLHGLMLVINHIWRRLNIKMNKALSWLITFISVVFAWVFFRANSVTQAWEIVKSMFGLNGTIFSKPLFVPGGIKQIFILFVLLLSLLILPSTKQLLDRFRPRWWVAIVVAAAIFISLLNLNHVSEFIYFQF